MSLVTCLAAAVLLLGLCGIAIASETDQATTYQITPTHNGCITTAMHLKPPLMKRWTLDFESLVSYPLIAEGKVFVTVRNKTSYGTSLHAIDAEFGSVIWTADIPGTYFWSGAAYGDGRVYVVNFDGRMKAFAAETGQLLWDIKLPGQYAFSSPPTFHKGIVYTGGAGSGGTVYAVDASSGAVLWTNGVANGDHSSPAVTDDGVYVTYACGVSYRFDPINGQRLWIHTTGCSGGGGKTPVFYDGKIYSRGYYPSPDGFVLDAATGSYLGGFYTQTTPTFYEGNAFMLYNYALRRMDANTLAELWTRAVGHLVTPPIIVNGVLYVGASDGILYAVDPFSGETLWSDNVGASINAPDEHNVSSPVAAIGAGEGIIVVPASNRLVAYQPANHNPEVSCTPPVVIECASPEGTDCEISASVSDLDGDGLAVTWFVDGTAVQTDMVEAGGESGTTAQLKMNYTYGLGTHEITVQAWDGIGSPVRGSTTVTVQDTSAPQITVTAEHLELRPANGEMVDIGFAAAVVDAGDVNPSISTSVYSDEDDVAGVAGAKLSPDAKWGPALKLRAERDSAGDGRVYLIVVKATDAAGNSSFGCLTVIVPKSNSATAIAVVKAQAAVAAEWCLANHGAMPDGFWVVGDAPQIGKKSQ